MKNIVLVGAYHKTGSQWMRHVFNQIAKNLEVPFHNLNGRAMPEDVKKKLIGDAVAEGQRCIFFDHHTLFPLEGLDLENVRGMRVVRNPRDLVLSAARYHCWSEEAWLHRSYDKFDGKTYAEMINALETFEDKVVFELDNSSGNQIRLMDKFNGHGVFVTAHYEDLIEDITLLRWHELVVHLGFEGAEIPVALKAFWDNSLFGGKKKSEKTKHLQNGSARQFEEAFTPRMHEEFDRRFKEIAARLNYG